MGCLCECDDSASDDSEAWPYYVWIPICVCLPCVYLWSSAGSAIEDAKTKITAAKEAKAEEKWRCHIRSYKLPPSTPLLSDLPGHELSRTSPLKGNTTFHNLPLEIRLRIYEYVLGGAGIVQVAWFPHWGPFPVHWSPGQHVRRDADPPSDALRRILGVRGDGFNQKMNPAWQDPRSRARWMDARDRARMICGDSMVYLPSDTYGNQLVTITSLMKCSRLIYGDLLRVLYSESTISLFGVEMVEFFLQNASPEGLAYVQYVHVALPLCATDWHQTKKRSAVEDALETLRSRCSSLRMLDVEVVVTWIQPQHPAEFRRWLKEDVLGKFRALDEFVLKISVLEDTSVWDDSFRAVVPGRKEVAGWIDADYQEIKAKVITSSNT